MKAKTGFNRFVSIFLSVAIAISALAGLSLGGLVSAAGEENTPMHIIVHLWHTVNIDGKVPADGSKDEVVLDGYFWKKGEGSYSFNGSSTDPTSNTKPTETSNVNREFSESSDTITIYSNVRHEGNKSDGKALENYAGFSVSAGHTAVDVTDDGNNSTMTIQFNENVHLVKVYIFYTNTSMYVAGTNNELVSGTSSVKFEDDRDTFYAYIDGDSIVPIENNEIGYYLSLGKELTKYYNTAEGLHTDKTAMETAMAGMGEGRTFDLSLESWFVGNKSADIGLVLDASGSMVSPSGDMKAIQLNVEGDLQKHFGADYQLIDNNGFLKPEVVDYILDPAMTDSSSLGVSGFKYYLFDAKTSNNDFFPLGYWNGEDKGTDEVTIDGAYTYDIPQREHLIGYYPFSTSGELAYDKEENEINNQKVSRVEKQDISSFNLSLNDDLDIKYSDSDGFRLDESAGGIKLNLGKDGDTKLGQNFTISFKIKSDKQSTNPANIKEILYIGPEENVDNNYFKAYRNSGGSSARFVAESGGNKALNVNTVFNVGNKSSAKETYITLVFSNGEVKAYTNGTEADDSASSNTVTLADENIIILNGLSDSYGSSPHIRLDELYVFDLALGSQDVKDMYEKIQSKNKNIDINEKSTITTGGDVYLAKSGDNVLGTIQKSVYNKAEKATDSDSPMRGWYYVSFGSDWDNYFSEVVGTAKDYRHVYGPASVYENDAEKKKGEEGLRYDLVYSYDEDDVIGEPEDYKGVVFYHDPDDCYVIGDEHEEVESKYTLIDGRTLEDHPDECRVSSLTYRPKTGSGTSDDNPSPIKFFIDKNGNLCCFFATGRSDKDMDGSYGWSYVFEKDDDAETKVESLQKALGSFTSGLFEGLPSSKVSAVRFSSDKIPIDTDSDKLVLLGWTSDPVEAGKMLSLQYGEGSGKGSSVSPTLSEGDSEGKNKQNQYNYGLTGGTTTQYGIQAYIENLKKAADEDKNAEKYLIIFTDGKDTDLSVKATGADGKVTQDDVQAAIEESEAYKKLKTLKEDNYTVFCVMLTGGVMNESTSGEIGDYEQALQFLVELSSDGGTYSGVDGKYPHVFVGDGSNLTAMFDAINEEISADLENYTVQDYIDPRFDLVDAEENVWHLNAGGTVTCENFATKSPAAIDIYKKGDKGSENDIDGDGYADEKQTDVTKLDKNNYAIINLPNSNNEEGTTAKLYFDNNADTNMYYLVWDNQDIPSCVKGDTSLKVWNATVTVRAKDDFIGGNAVTTNGNSAGQNYVYMNDDTAPSSGTTNAGKDYDPAAASYPSKGFPRTTVNVAVPSLVLTGGEQVIYMGEELTPDGVAEKLGETILDEWATVTGADKSGTQWYWEYLERYAKYENTKYPKGLEDIIKEIVAAEKNGKGSIEYPYFYIPRYDEDNKLLNQTGSSEQHEKDRLGTLKFTWTTVDEDKDGSKYPNDNKGGTTVDTLQRVSTLEVQYTPLQADDGNKGDDTKYREDYIKDIVQTEKDSGKDVYPWDPEYKPAAGEPTGETTNETSEDTSDDGNGLLDTGSYKTNIVRGQINLDWEDPDDVLNDLINFFPTKTIKYTADLYRSYNGKETKVGTFEFSIVCDETAKTATHNVKLTLDEDFKKLTDEGRGGLPIGEYYIDKETEKTTIDDKKLSCLTFTAKATAINAYVEQFAEDIYKHAPEAAAAITSDDITKYAAPFSDVNIQLGYNKTTKEKTDENYTDDLLGMYIASPNLLKGDLSIIKNVIDNVNSDGNRKNDGKEFTFKVTLEGVSGSFTAKGGKYGDGTTINGTPNGDSTVYTITVRASEDKTETVTIEGIPAGTKYTVEEVEPTDPNGYTLNKEKSLNVTGEIEAGATKTATFVNEYNAEGTVQFYIKKTLVGRDWISGETFTFAVKPDADTAEAISNEYIEMPVSVRSDGKYVIAVAKDDTPFLTDEIKFKKAGTYTFTVSEVNNNKPDVAENTQTYTLTVTVKDRDFGEEDGKLTTSVSYAYETDNQGEPNEKNPIPFVNTVSTQIDFDITKVLKGRDWETDDSFTVDIEYVPEESTKSYPDAKDPFIEASSVTISDGKNPKGTATVTFYSVGTYTFTVKEVKGTDSNMLYDKDYEDGHTVTVEVDQNNDDGLYVKSVQIDKDDPVSKPSSADITITNEYTVTKDVSINIPVTKTFADDNWINGTYSFDIDFDKSVSEADKAKIKLPDSVNISVKDGTAYFEDISFKNIVLEEDPINGGYSKSFKFVVKEQNGGDTINGITYDKTVYNVEVTITDKSAPDDVSVKVTKAGETGDVTEMSFKNVYSATGSVQIPVSKVLDGRDWKNGESFKFEIASDDYTFPVDYQKSITITNDANDKEENVKYSEVFKLDFDLDDIKEKDTFTFTITEKDESSFNSHVEYSDEEYTVEVTVKDNGDGTLDAEIAKVTEAKDPTKDLVENGVVFTNTYTPDPVKWTPSIEKQIDDTKEGTGRDKNWLPTDEFTFTITQAEDDLIKVLETPETVTIDNKTALKDGDEKTRFKPFGEITFTKAGVYTFTIKENGESKDGIILDVHRSYKVTVTVSDDSEGTLSITNIAYEDRDKKHVDQTTGTNSTAFLFINTHEHEAVHWKPTVSKDIYGRDWISGETFGFTIALADGQKESIVNNVRMPSPNVATVTGKDTKFPFTDITFTEIGEYKFIVKENDLTEPTNGLTKDETKYNVTVTVENDDDSSNPKQLKIAKVEVNYGTTTKTYTDPKEVNVNFKFTNIYSASGTTIGIPVSKNLEGRAWKPTDSFTFEISTTTAYENVTIPADSKTVTINGTGTEGTHKGTFADIEFTKVGTYTFTIKESQESTIDHITYSKEVYTVTVEVTDNGDGTLNAKITKVTEAKDPTEDLVENGVVFTNTYTPTSTTWTPSVSKVIEDTLGDTERSENWLSTDKFTFTITQAEDDLTKVKTPETVIIDNETPTVDGKIKRSKSFDPITFTEAGTYHFTIKENPVNISGIYRDKTVYDVTVVVSDDTNGTLSISSVTYTYTDSTGKTITEEPNDVENVTFLFVNKHHHGAVNLRLSIDKTIANREWQTEDEFEFTIEQESTDKHQVALPGTLTVTKSGGIAFDDAIMFTEIGEYNFTVREINTPDYFKCTTPTDGSYALHIVIASAEDKDSNLYISSMTVNGKEVTDLPKPSDTDFEAKRPTISHVLEFENKYSASGTTAIPVYKILNGRDWNDGESFEFEIDSKDYIFPEDYQKSITIENTEGNKLLNGEKCEGSFEGLTFGLDDVGKTFTFTITEVASSNSHVAYSKEAYTVTVEVTDNYNGTLKAEITEVTEAKGPTKNLGEYGVVFTNTYTPEPATWTPGVQKTLEGHEWENYTFTFSITPTTKDGIFYDDDGDGTATAPYVKNDVTISAAEDTPSFNTVTFTKADTYEFTIAEVVDNSTKYEKIVYDTTPRNVKVVVKEAENEEKLVVESVSVNDEPLVQVDNVILNFTNYYTDDVVLQVEKNLDTSNGGRDWFGTDDFSFTLTLNEERTIEEGGDVNNVIMPELCKAHCTESAQTAQFGGIGFNGCGTYVFNISEDIPTEADNCVYQGVTYDNKVYEVIITVEEVTDETDPENPVTEIKTTVSGEGVENDTVTFTNTAYYPTDASVNVKVQKTLEGKEWEQGDSFSFKIEPKPDEGEDYGEYVVMPTETEISISADTLDYTASFGGITFKKDGKYTFTISEVLPEGVDSSNWTYAEPQDIEVEVTYDKDTNSYVATIQGSDTVTVEFTNKYTSPSTDPTPPTDPTPSTPTQPSENTTSEDTSAPEQTTGPEETTPEETTSEETTASSEESTVPSEETTPDTTDSEDVSENDGYNTNVDGDGDKNMNTGVPFGSAIMMCALSSLAVAVAVRKKKNGRNDK